jgi:IPT/TIG domain
MGWVYRRPADVRAHIGLAVVLYPATSGEITGTGSLAAQVATVSGTATRTITGTGTPASQAATVAGTGSLVVAPTVASVSPDNGPFNGGTSVTITGTGFVNGATVTFGGVAATSVVVVDSTTITCIVPAQA